MPSATEVDLDRASIDSNVRSGTYDAPVPSTAAAEQTAPGAAATKVLKFSPSLEEVHHGGVGGVPTDDGAGRVAGGDGAPPPRASSPVAMPDGAGGDSGKGLGGGGTAAVTPGLKAKDMMRFIDGGDDDAAPSPGGGGVAGDGPDDGRTKPAGKKTVSPGDSDKKKSKPAGGAKAKAEAKKPRNTLQNYFGKAGAGGAGKKKAAAGGAPSRRAPKPSGARTVHPPAPQRSKPSAKPAKSRKKKSAAPAGRGSSEPSAADQPGKSDAARPSVKLVIHPADYPELVNVLEEATVIMRAGRSKSAGGANPSVEAEPAAEADKDAPAGSSPPAEPAEAGPTEAAGDRGEAGPAVAKSGQDGAEAESKPDSDVPGGASPPVEIASAEPAEAAEDGDGAEPADSSGPAGAESSKDGVVAGPSEVDVDVDAAAEDDSPKSDAEKPQRDPLVATANAPAGSVVEVTEKSVAMEEEDEDDATIAMEEEDDDGTVAMEIDPSKKSAPPADGDDRTAGESSDGTEAGAEIVAAPIPAEIETSAGPADGDDDVAMDDADETKSNSPSAEERSDEKKDGPARDSPAPPPQAPSEGAPEARDKPRGRKKRDPGAPKGARTAFTYYKAASRDALKAAHPDARAAEINALLGRHWKELGEEARAPYQEQARADRERHGRETAEYEARSGEDGPPAAKTAAKTAPSAKKNKQGKAAGAARGIASLASSFRKQEVTCPKRTRERSPAGRPSPAAPRPAAEKPSSAPARSPRPAEQPRAVLSGESAAKLAEHSSRRDRWVRKAAELASRPGTEELEEEKLRLEEAKLPDVEKGSVEVDEGRFPDALLTHLLVLVQGRSLPLSKLAQEARGELSPYVKQPETLTPEAISNKIKLLSQRKAYLSGNPAPSDPFENADAAYMWRWEVSSLDLLPQNESKKVKRAQKNRRKLQSFHKAITGLVDAIDKANAWGKAPSKAANTTAAGEKLVAKIIELDAKVSKFEGEEEIARLKLKTKTDEAAAKEAERKKREEEKELKKASAEAAKLKKAEEKESKKRQKQEKEQEKSKKNKARMMTFFGGPAKKKQKVGGSSRGLDVSHNARRESFDCEAFRLSIDSRDEHGPSPFAKHSRRTIESRRRRTAKVRMTTFVTVLSENAFAPQPYDEERVVVVPNRYKFLGFHEDVRPPYRGTWSKTSDIVNGRNSFRAKDTKYMDYEHDSEAEWEEGDDEEGEDLQDEKDDGEEEEIRNEQDDDGWLAAEDDLGLEDEDDETIEMRKKKVLSAAPASINACVIAPRMGGIPCNASPTDDISRFSEGFSTPNNANEAMASYVGRVISPDATVCLDAFPPTVSSSSQKKESTGKSSSKEMSPESQKIMARFVHNGTFKSKDLAISELLNAHPNVASSRAQATRELDVIADKRNLGKGAGFVWEVKADHLKKLGLAKKDLKKPPPGPSDDKSSSAKKSKDKDPNAPTGVRTAFSYYTKAKREEVRASNPEAKAGEILSLLGKHWKELGKEAKAPYQEQAAADKERYRKEMADYNAKIGTADDQAVSRTAEVPPVKDTSKVPTKPLANKTPTEKKRKIELSGGTKNLMQSFFVKKSKQN